mgnify:CR=1 FL=1
MNRIFPTILAAAALSGCGGPNYTLSGKAGLAPGDTLRLCSPYENDSVLAVTVVRSDSTFRIRGYEGIRISKTSRSDTALSLIHISEPTRH